MGVGGSVDKKATGKSKTLLVTIKDDATDLRQQSGPSYIAEVHVRDDASQHIDVLFICNEWGSFKGGLPTFNREFAVNLAKAASDRIKVHCYVCSSSEEDRLDANKRGVNLITARHFPGSNDPIEWLKFPPPELLRPDVVVGHGRKFGSPAYFISERTKCKWIHFVHVFCEDLGKHKLECSSTPDAIADNEEKNKRELELCEAGDMVVAVGISLQQKYIRRIPKIEVITPGLCEMFTITNQPRQPAHGFHVFMIGRGSFEDFALKGYDIVGKAVALLDRKFELTFVGSAKYEQRRIEKWFLEETKIARNQLTIRGYCNNEEMKKVFCEADVIVMPSRTEGFGLVALEAISAGVPVLVSSESGIAKALERVEDGETVVVTSDKPEDWARRIQQLSMQKPTDRYASAMHLRDKYGESYCWRKQCERFEEMIHGLIQRPHRDVPLNYELRDQTGNITVKVEAVPSAQDNGLVQTNRGRNPLSASPSSSKSTEADRNPEGDLATGLRGNSSVDKNETTGNSLHSAARAGDVTEIESLLAQGFSIDMRNDHGKTALMLAAVNDKLQAVKYLLDNGADPTLQNNYGANVLHHASRGGNPEVIELMLSHVPSIDSINHKGSTSLMIAAAYDKLQAVKYLLDHEADPSLQNNKGWNVLHYASQGGNPEVIELMLSHVPSIDSINHKGSTSLMIAAVNDKLQAVKYLLDHGADPSLQNNKGWNMLHHASHGGNPEVIELMLSHVPSIDSVTHKGSASLMIAAVNDKLQAVKYLLDHGADPSLQNNKGWNVLHHASQGGNPEVIELMLSHVPSIDSKTHEGVTSLMIAAVYDKLQAVKYLLDHGADPSLQNNDEWNVLHYASKGGNPQVIELMLSHVPSIDSKTHEGSTSLMIAAGNDKLQAVKYLLDHGADPTLQDNDGGNVLHYASMVGNVAIMEKILSYGFDIESRTKFGETPLKIAQSYGKSGAVTYLLSKGAKSSR